MGPVLSRKKSEEELQEVTIISGGVKSNPDAILLPIEVVRGPDNPKALGNSTEYPNNHAILAQRSYFATAYGLVRILPSILLQIFRYLRILSRFNKPEEQNAESIQKNGERNDQESGGVVMPAQKRPYPQDDDVELEKTKGLEKPGNVPEDTEEEDDSNNTGESSASIYHTKSESAVKKLKLLDGSVGKRKGIEGAHNSCYLDAFLFSTFYSTKIFDYLLKPKPDDKDDIKKTRTILRENIVAPLRDTYYCGYTQVWELREHLSPINGDLKGSFMDAEQVLYILCKTALKEPHFIRYDVKENSDWGDYMLLMTPDLEDSVVGTVQKTMEYSFAFNGNIKMAGVPNPAFIMGMPRSDRILIHYKAVIPNGMIDIKKYLHPATCECGKDEPEWEIQSLRGSTETLSSKPICKACVVAATKVNFEEKQIVSREKMKLNAIMCIRGCHFVAFVLASKEQVTMVR